MRKLRDSYDINGNKTNKTYRKGDIIFEGYYPMVVIRNSNGEFLMQKRVKSKVGDWGATRGHPKSGETLIERIITEAREELELDFSNKMYFVTKNINLKDIKIQEDELTEVRWFSMEELIHMVETNELNEDQIACFKKVCLFLN